MVRGCDMLTVSINFLRIQSYISLSFFRNSMLTEPIDMQERLKKERLLLHSAWKTRGTCHRTLLPSTSLHPAFYGTAKKAAAAGRKEQL